MSDIESDIELCDWCGSVFCSDRALFDLLPAPAGRRVVAAACSPEHMQALGGRVHEASSEPGQAPLAGS